MKNIVKFTAAPVRFVFPLLFFLTVSVLSAYSTERITDIGQILEDMEEAGEGLIKEEFDSNADGNMDYTVTLDGDGVRFMESLDFNHDGVMDDLYFYSEGIIVRREIDSNFDRKIDIWVYIKEGSYIEKYEQDLDFDGVVDKTKVFGGDSDT